MRRHAALVTSALLHIALIMAFAVQLKQTHPFVHFGNSHKQVVSTYLYHTASSAKPAASHKIEHKIARHLKHAIALSHRKPKPQPANNKRSAAAHRRAQVAGKPMPALIALLHHAIQQQQRYPASAEEMEREGRVCLMFTLSPNGTVQNLHIAKSSGTSSLDNAAIAAVNRAMPFHKVDKFIHSPQNYQIDVVFQLS